MSHYQKVLSNSIQRPALFEGVFLPPDNIIIKSGQSAGAVDLIIARGDSDAAAGIVLTKDEALQLIECLVYAMGDGDEVAT